MFYYGCLLWFWAWVVTIFLLWFCLLWFWLWLFTMIFCYVFLLWCFTMMFYYEFYCDCLICFFYYDFYYDCLICCFYYDCFLQSWQPSCGTKTRNESKVNKTYQMLFMGCPDRSSQRNVDQNYDAKNRGLDASENTNRIDTTIYAYKLI